MKTTILKSSKTIIVIFALFLLGSCALQQEVPGSNRGDNTVLIITGDHPDDAYRKMGQILAERGFSIQSSDREMGSISTAPTSLHRRMRWEAQVNVVVSDSESATIALSGSSRIDREGSWARIYDRGSRTGHQQAGWTELYEIAKKYEGAEIAFEAR